MTQRILAPFSVIKQAIISWWDDLVNQFVLNLAWVFCQVSIVFGPAATLSIFHLSRQLVDGSAPNFREFVQYTKHYFIKGWTWMAVNMLAVIIVASNLAFYGRIETAWAFYVRLLFVGLALLWLPMQFYALPYLVIQEESSLRLAWKNALYTVLASPAYTFVIFLFAAAVIVVSLVTILPLFFGIWMLLPTLANHAIKERLETFRLMMQEEAPDEDQ